MKIRKIVIENNKILGNLELNFINQSGNVFDTIIFVGENGSGKSTLLNIIYNFTILEYSNLGNSEKITFEIEFSDKELDIINKYKNELHIMEYPLQNIFEFTFNYSINTSNIHQICIVTNKAIPGDISIGLFLKEDTKPLLKSIFSDVSINFNSQNIESIRNSDTDINITTSKKSSENISTEITQMLVDIYNKDAGSLQIWVDENPGIVPTDEIKLVRTKRFRNSFNKIFNDSNLEYLGVKDLKPIFKKNGNEIEINNLSSGEKQIVFRGGYLLKDKQSIKGAIALIDEPEISLHPIWQQKILDFYTYLFKSESGEQTSQIFITTHSPYVLQGYNLNGGGLFVFPGGKRVDNLRSYIGNKPSLGVVNYEAYNLPTVEFHDELYGYIYDKTNSSKLIDIDNYISSNGIVKNINRIELPGKNYNVTLPTFIRNKLHHPENVNMSNMNFSNEDLKKSIDEMIKIINSNSL